MNPKDRTFWQQLGVFGAIGMELAVSIGAGLLAGYYLDRRLETIPIFSIIFLLVGITVGFYNLYKIIERLSR